MVSPPKNRSATKPLPLNLSTSAALRSYVATLSDRQVLVASNGLNSETDHTSLLFSQ
jgi:hypothetical protein